MVQQLSQQLLLAQLFQGLLICQLMLSGAHHLQQPPAFMAAVN